MPHVVGVTARIEHNIQASKEMYLYKGYRAMLLRPSTMSVILGDAFVGVATGIMAYHIDR